MLERKCPNPAGNPKCKLVVAYVHLKTMVKAEKNGSLCHSCRVFGESNPFYGKKHVFTDEWRAKISAGNRRAIAAGKVNWMKGKKHTEETKLKMSLVRKGRPKSEETKKRMAAAFTEARRVRMSKMMSGPGNPQFKKQSAFLGKKHTEQARLKMSKALLGRVPVRNVGGSFSGFYKGLHFRSSCELNYLILHGTKGIESAEIYSLRIPYLDSDGKKRFYYADWFNAKEKVLIEIKPPAWRGFQKDVEEKTEAARKFCAEKGFTFELIEIENLPKDVVFRLHAEEVIQLDNKLESKIRAWAIPKLLRLAQ